MSVSYLAQAHNLLDKRLHAFLVVVHHTRGARRQRGLVIGMPTDTA